MTPQEWIFYARTNAHNIEYSPEFHVEGAQHLAAALEEIAKRNYEITGHRDEIAFLHAKLSDAEEENARLQAELAQAERVVPEQDHEWVYHYHAEVYTSLGSTLHSDGLLHSDGPVNSKEAYELTRENIRKSMPGEPLEVTLASFSLLHGPDAHSVSTSRVLKECEVGVSSDLLAAYRDLHRWAIHCGFEGWIMDHLDELGAKPSQTDALRAQGKEGAP